MIILMVLLILLGGQRHITEDDPRWDCRTMGNHICGN